MRRLRLLLASVGWLGLASVGSAACGGASGPGGSGYEEFDCPAPIGKIVREDCSKQAIRYQGDTFAASVGGAGIGANANYTEKAIREADSLVQILKDQRVALCNDFNTCKLSVPEYRAESARIDDTFVGLLALKDKMAAMDAQSAATLLKELARIRDERATHGRAAASPPPTQSHEGRPPPARDPPPAVAVSPRGPGPIEVNWKGSWYRATVIGARGSELKIHYDGFADSWDEWVGPERVRPRGGAAVAPPAPPPTEGLALRRGEAIKVLWKGSWFPAHVMQARGGTFQIHYDGYADSWDEWVGPDRIRPR